MTLKHFIKNRRSKWQSLRHVGSKVTITDRKGIESPRVGLHDPSGPHALHEALGLGLGLGLWWSLGLGLLRVVIGVLLRSGTTPSTGSRAEREPSEGLRGG
jgi:hypothetical protein